MKVLFSRKQKSVGIGRVAPIRFLTQSIQRRGGNRLFPRKLFSFMCLRIVNFPLCFVYYRWRANGARVIRRTFGSGTVPVPPEAGGIARSSRTTQGALGRGATEGTFGMVLGSRDRRPALVGAGRVRAFQSRVCG